VQCSSSPLTYRFYVLPYVSPRLSINKSRVVARKSLSYPVPGGREEGSGYPRSPWGGPTIATSTSLPRTPSMGKPPSDGQLSHSGSTSSIDSHTKRGAHRASQARRRDRSAISPTHTLPVLCPSTTRCCTLKHTVDPATGTYSTTNTIIALLAPLLTLSTTPRPAPRTTHSTRPSSNADTLHPRPHTSLPTPSPHRALAWVGRLPV
jgi:hypothetical protein